MSRSLLFTILILVAMVTALGCATVDEAAKKESQMAQQLAKADEEKRLKVEELIRRVNESLERKDFTASIFYLEQVLKIQPENTAIKGRIEAIKIERERVLKGASGMYKETTQSKKVFLENLNADASNLINQGRLDEAWTILENARNIDSRNATTLCNIGTWHFKKREYKEAIEAYNEALKVDPNDWQSHLGIGNVLLSQNKVEEARTYLEKAKALNSNPATVSSLKALWQLIVRVGQEEVDKLNVELQKVLPPAPPVPTLPTQ